MPIIACHKAQGRLARKITCVSGISDRSACTVHTEECMQIVVTFVQRCGQKVISTLLGTTRTAGTCLIGSQCSTLLATETLSSQVLPASSPKGALGALDGSRGMTGRAQSGKADTAGVAQQPAPCSMLPGHRSQRYKHVPGWAKLTKLAGGTVLHVAAACGNWTLVSQLLKSAQRELLEQRTCLGYTALSIAAACGQATALKALLAAKGDTAALTGKSEPLLHVALQSRSNDVLHLLTARGLHKTMQLVCCYPVGSHSSA